MNSQQVNQRYRLFLLLLAAFIFVGTVVELWFEEHTESAVQYIPFVLSGLGLVAVTAVLLSPQRQTVWGLRIVMAITFLGSLFGIFEHIEHNLEFALEIQPNAVVSDVFWQALGGGNPLLAPGILALGAMLAAAATYYHPVLTAHK